MNCVVELPNRAKKGKPVACGKSASTFRVSGKLTWVYADLCEDHARKMRARGYTLEKVDPADQERIAS
jgi:hypothetical protein